MRAGRLTAIGAGFVLAASGAACSAATGGSATPTKSSRPAVSIPADPAAALAAAKAGLGSESARFAEKAGPGQPTYTGLVNAGTGNWEITAEEYVLRRVGTDLFIRASGKTLESMFLPQATIDHLTAGGWVHTRLPNGRELTTEYNDKFPWNWTNAATRADGMTKTGDRTFTGKLAGRTPAADLRVTVDLDPQGRFSKLRLDSTGKVTGKSAVFTYSDYGVAADITAPPSVEVVAEDNPSFLSGALPF